MADLPRKTCSQRIILCWVTLFFQSEVFSGQDGGKRAPCLSKLLKSVPTDATVDTCENPIFRFAASYWDKVGSDKHRTWKNGNTMSTGLWTFSIISQGSATAEVFGVMDVSCMSGLFNFSSRNFFLWPRVGKMNWRFYISYIIGSLRIGHFYLFRQQTTVPKWDTSWKFFTWICLQNDWFTPDCVMRHWVDSVFQDNCRVNL